MTDNELTKNSNRIRGNAFACDTVDNTLRALQHELIKEDIRLSKREPNIYRIGNYLKALERCEKPKPKSLKELAERIEHSFNKGFGPRDRTLRALGVEAKR